MIKRIKYGFFIAGLLLCCLFAGYYFGYCRGKGIAPEKALQQSTGQEDIKITYNKTIAIVNLDEGIQQQGEQENYSIKLIDTITDDVVITGLEDARRGIESGTYSAYMVIPAAFSEQVYTITTQPVKSEITYAIGSGLTGEEREAVIYRMESIFRLFNNNLSKVYLSSVLAEYHKAQDSASSIISNDTEDMERLLQVRGEDLIEYIETPPVTVVENDIPKLNLTDHYAKNSQTIEQINSAYQEFNKEGMQAIELIKKDFDRTAETIGELQGELITMEETVETLTNIPWNDSEQAAKEDAFYLAKKEALTGMPDADEGETEDEIKGDGADGDVTGDEGTEEKHPEGILTAYNSSLQEKQEEMLLAFLKGLREETNLPGEDEQEVYIDEFLKEQSPLPTIDIAAVDQEIDALIQTAKDSRTLRNEEIEKRRGDWAQIQEQMKTIRASYDEVNTAHEETKTDMTSFDLASFIDEGEINGYLQQMKDSLRNVETKVENQMIDYEEYVSRVYEATDNNIRSFEEEIARGQEQSEKKLVEGLEEAKNSRQKNSENNIRLLNELIVQMPYTRVGEVENREVYDFIAEPILTTDQSVVKKAIQEKEGIQPDTIVFITVFCIFILLLGGVQIVTQRRRISEQWE